MRFSWLWWRLASKRWGGIRTKDLVSTKQLGLPIISIINVWECPAGQYLKLWAFDSQRRIAQYRAEAKSCNSCALKKNCTDSEDGRTLEHHLDSWLQSEVRRFHRGISLALLFLAGLILSVEMTLQTATTDLAVLLGAMVPVAIVATRLGFGNGGVFRRD